MDGCYTLTKKVNVKCGNVMQYLLCLSVLGNLISVRILMHPGKPDHLETSFPVMETPGHWPNTLEIVCVVLDFFLI